MCKTDERHCKSSAPRRLFNARVIRKDWFPGEENEEKQ